MEAGGGGCYDSIGGVGGGTSGLRGTGSNYLGGYGGSSTAGGTGSNEGGWTSSEAGSYGFGGKCLTGSGAYSGGGPSRWRRWWLVWWTVQELMHKVVVVLDMYIHQVQFQIIQVDVYLIAHIT